MAWTVGKVQDTMDSRRDFAGSGFSILDEHHRPIATFGYLTNSEASRASELMREAIKNAKVIHTTG